MGGGRGKGGAGRSGPKNMSKKRRYGLLLASHASDLDSPGHLDSALFLLFSTSLLFFSTLASLPSLSIYFTPLQSTVLCFSHCPYLFVISPVSCFHLQPPLILVHSLKLISFPL